MQTFEEEEVVVAALSADTKLRSRYHSFRFIGRGAQGLVMRATSARDSKERAVKLIPRSSLTGSSAEKELARKRALRELENHSRLCHPLIVQYLGAFVSDSFLVVGMEYADSPVEKNRVRRSLFDLLALKKDGMKEGLVRHYFQQLMIAVDYCHRVKVTNRDIKLEHCLLNKTPKSDVPMLKVCDWGLSKCTRPESSLALSLVGTPGYWAPEVVVAHRNEIEYDPYKADVFSCGVLLYKMLYGLEGWPLGDGEKEYQLFRDDSLELYNVALKKLEKPRIQMGNDSQPQVSQEVRELLKGMLETDSQQRYTVADVINSAWFQEKLPPTAKTLNDKLTSPEELARISPQIPTTDSLVRLVNQAASIHE